MTYDDSDNARLTEVKKAIDFELPFDKELWQSIVLIFARAGTEAGKIKRILDENLISWGYFTDHNQFQPHCNAHANNFVVVDPRSNPNGNILALVDLDMAFKFDEFVNTVDPDPFFFSEPENLKLQSERYKTNDRMQFDDWNN